MKILNTNSKITAAFLISSGLCFGLTGCNINLNVDGETVASINTTKTGVLNLSDENDVSVNGTTYDTQNATVIIDGIETDVSDLKSGMVVSVHGSESSDGTANAVTITYEDDVEGMVSSNSLNLSSSGSDNGVLTVLGQTVNVNSDTVFESDEVNDLSIGDIDIGNIVEVSGYSSGDGEILATRIEVKDIEYNIGDKVELKGDVSNLSDTTFNIGDLSINIENASLDNDFMGTLKNGQYVEVSSYEGFDDSGNLIANEIELKNDDGKEISHSNDDEYVEIKGAITMDFDNTAQTNMTLEVNGSIVLLSSNLSISENTRSNLIVGTIVEVEGYMDAEGNFLATELEIENDSDSDSDSSSDSSSDSDLESNDDDDDDDDDDDESKGDENEASEKDDD